MANYINYWRSNRFQVIDLENFLNAIESVECNVDYEDNHVVLTCPYDIDTGSNWSYYYDQKSDDYVYPVWSEIAANNLVENEVIVFIEIGFKKLRYIVGQAVAYSWTGEKVSCNLNDIYKVAQEEFGDTANITLAKY